MLLGKLEKTPERVAKAMQFLTHGYALDPLEILKELSLKIIAK
jgi:GTP cyclohydrolase I